MNYPAGKKLRLARRKDIDNVFRGGKRAAGGCMTLVASRNELSYSRGGVAVSTAHGGAVHRNRIKRTCREAFRLTRPLLPTGWDFMILPRKGVDPELFALCESLLKLARKLANGLAGTAEDP